MRWKLSRAIEWYLVPLFWLFLLLHIAYKIWLLLEIGFVYTDNDQGILWMTTRNFSALQHIEPRFYGQNYNSPFEAVLAIPLYKMGIPLYKALPIVTSLLASFPFLLLASLCMKHGERVSAILILVLSMAFPLPYDLLSNLPRGFVTGLAVASLNFMLLFGASPRWKWIMGGAASLLALILNPNSALLIAPIYLLLLSRMWHKKASILYLLFGALPFLLLQIWANQYYVSHPEMIIHEMGMYLDWESFTKAFSNWDGYFGILMPLFSEWSVLYFVLALCVSAWFFYQKKWEVALAVLSVPVLCSVSLLVSKVHEGNSSLYLSVSRMFLALPIYWALVIKLLKPGKWALLSGFILLFILPYKMSHAEERVLQEASIKSVVKVRTVVDVMAECENLKSLSEQHGAELILIDDYQYQDVIDYTCLGCMDDFPVILRPEYERKHWDLSANIQQVHPRILIVSEPLDIYESLRSKGLAIRKVEKYIYLATDNTLPLYQFLDSAGIILPNKLKRPFGLE